MRQRTDRADYPALQADTTNCEIQGDCCCLRRQLAEQFAINARLYSEAVVRLTRSGQTSGDYDQLLAATVEAQGRAEVAQIAFEEHVKTHGCDMTERTEPKANAGSAG
jgi:hypothetical protein